MSTRLMQIPHMRCILTQTLLLTLTLAVLAGAWHAASAEIDVPTARPEGMEAF